jgi:hypothetical protein
MGLKVSDISTIINNYRQDIGKKVLPASIDLNEVNKDINYISELMSKAKGSEIEFTSQEEINRVMKAVNTLSFINQQDSVKALEDNIRLSNERMSRNIFDNKKMRSKMAFAATDPSLQYQSMRTIGQVKDMLDKWSRKKDRIYITKQNEARLGGLVTDKSAQETLRLYDEISKGFSDDTRRKALTVINNLRDPNQLFYIEKEKHTKQLDSFIRRQLDANANKGNFAQNTLVIMDDDKGDMTEAEYAAYNFVKQLVDEPEERDVFTPLKDEIAKLAQISGAINAPSSKQIQDAKKARAEANTKKIVEKKASEGVPYKALSDQEKKFLANEGVSKGINSAEGYYVSMFDKAALAAAKESPEAYQAYLDSKKGPAKIADLEERKDLFKNQEVKIGQPGVQEEQDLKVTGVKLSSTTKPASTDVETKPKFDFNNVRVATPIIGSNPSIAIPEGVESSVISDVPEYTGFDITPTIQPLNISEQINSIEKQIIALNTQRKEISKQSKDLENQILLNRGKSIEEEANELFQKDNKEIVKNYIEKYGKIDIQNPPYKTNTVFIALIAQIKKARKDIEEQFNKSNAEVEKLSEKIQKLENQKINLEAKKKEKDKPSDESNTVSDSEKLKANELKSDEVQTPSKMDEIETDIATAQEITNKRLADLEKINESGKINEDDPLVMAGLDELKQEDTQVINPEFNTTAATAIDMLDGANVQQTIDGSSPMLGRPQRASTPRQATLKPVGFVGRQINIFQSFSPRSRADHDRIINDRVSIFSKRMKEGDFFGAYADLPTLLEDNKLEKYIKYQVGELGNYKDSLAHSVVNYFHETELSKDVRTATNNWRTRRDAKRALRRKKWNDFKSDIKEHTFIGQKFSIYQSFRARLKKEEKKVTSWAAEEILKKAIKGVFSGIAGVADGATSALNRIPTVFGLKGAFGNLTTSVYKGLDKMSGLKSVEPTQAIDYVRQGFKHFGLLAGEAGVVVEGLSHIGGAVLKAGPIGLLAGFGTSLSMGPIVGTAVGVIVGGGQLTTELLKHDYSGMLRTLGAAEELGALPSGSIGTGWMAKGIRSAAGFTRNIFSRIQTAGHIPAEPIAGEANAVAQEAAKPLLQMTRFNRLIRAGSAGFTTFAILNSVLFPLLGPIGTLYAAGIGLGVTGGKYLIDRAINSAIKNNNLLYKNLMSVPLTQLFGSAFNISMIGQELSILQKKYNWDFRSYAKNEWGNNSSLNNAFKTANVGLGLKGLIDFPKALAALLRSDIFATAFSKIGLSSGTLVAPIIAGITLSLVMLAVMGVNLTSTVILSSIIGGTIAGVGTAAILASLSIPISTPFVVAIVAIGGVIGGWIGSWLDKGVGRLFDGFRTLLGGIQAIFELLIAFRNGFKFEKLMNYMMALISAMSFLYNLDKFVNTNACTIDGEECNNKYAATSSKSNYLANYDVTIVSADQSKHVANIQKITAMLDRDPTILERTYPGKQKYIFVNDTDDSYVNDTLAVIAISQNSLYFNNDTNLALISPK